MKTTKDSVSFLYYPSGSVIWGHVKLEVNNTAHAAVCRFGGRCGIGYTRKFNELKASSKTNGYLGIRYKFKVNRQQLAIINKSIKKGTYFTCSHGALTILSKAKVVSVPFPISLSPLLSAIYLYRAKKLGDCNIDRIKIYSNDNNRLLMLKTVTGVFLETLLLVTCVSLIFYISAIFFREVGSVGTPYN